MDSSNLPIPPQESTDIFSLSDQVLSDRLQFIEEIGFGNWGSVWLCRPKSSASSPGADGLSNVPDQKIAVKLVHRSKTTTTAARVRSLWNEMKIVRTFKSDPHPSIIPFHSFIITPSYALITMAFLPTLIPVEVDEMKAREWFRFLLSGVEFLHKRGVVHNDIKPANILLSPKNVPVLVDFGFAEKYDVTSTTAFHSNLSYGTPEYLSPERARGLPHDTRKSDIWSLGITFFEILIGRTPFENSDGEQFTTKEDLEMYWSRTLRGKWVGNWKMSKDMERMLRRMVAPNADLRCTASQAMVDPYWRYRKDSAAMHRRSSSYTSSIVFEKDMAKLMNATPPRIGKGNLLTPPGLDPLKSSKESLRSPQLTKSKSQPKVAATNAVPRKRVPVPAPADLSPIKASPPSSSFLSAGGKENAPSTNTFGARNPGARKPLGAISARENLPQSRLAPKPSGETVNNRKSRALADLTVNRNTLNINSKKDVKGKTKDKDHVRERVKEWEREKQRLREMERLEEIERERDEQIEEVKLSAARETRTEVVKEQEQDKENRFVGLPPPPVVPSPTISTFTMVSYNTPTESPPPSANDSLGVFKHNIRKSIDKTVRLYKTSALAQATGRLVSHNLSPDVNEGDTESGRSQSERESWEDEVLLDDAKSSLPVVRHAAHNERIAADARMDRMTIWMRNVEKVVEDARQNFASSSTHQLAQLPPLPIAPVSRSASQSRTNRSSRLPRKVLAASQIFSDENDRSVLDYTMSSTTSPANATINTVITDDTAPLEERSQLIPEIHTPSRQRRATVSTGSPGALLNMESDSPSKRREKSKSHGNLFQKHIAPVSLLEAELSKLDAPASSPRLSQVLDSSLFISPPNIRVDGLDMQDMSVVQEPSFNELTSSPLHVEPYPARRRSAQDMPLPDSPSQRRVEGVYDRFLMATSGVKRLGKGYQSDNIGPVSNTVGPAVSYYRRDNGKIFHSTRRPMPPPVSSDDQRRTVSVDELGVITYVPTSEESGSSPGFKDEGNTTVALVRRAIKAFVPGKTASKRLSRMA
ncbi:kinase-like domain-containing protein [Collybia nuda]|uniref:Kinase-like domain-containing protein n=1 Tax=Collybia nuda TaxID=64659 RepID=A0A9P6CJM7_9AGAR|nr:kinase-like domain-containing protein [Collybia nuda]